MISMLYISRIIRDDIKKHINYYYDNIIMWYSCNDNDKNITYL